MVGAGGALLAGAADEAAEETGGGEPAPLAASKSKSPFASPLLAHPGIEVPPGRGFGKLTTVWELQWTAQFLKFSMLMLLVGLP